MKTKIYFYAFLIALTSLGCYSQEMTKDGMKYTVVAKLRKSYNHDCDCQSRIISNRIFNFRIIEINMKGYYLNDINIVIPCPEGYGVDFFEKDSAYKIEFYDNCTDMNMDEGVCDYDIPKRKKMNRRFWVHSIVKLDEVGVSR